MYISNHHGPPTLTFLLPTNPQTHLPYQPDPHPHPSISREPYTLRATLPEMQEQGRTGKIYNAGADRWGRPVVIFNNSVNNSNDPRAQMRYLAFNLETALRKARAAEGANVAKFVIFMHMYVWLVCCLGLFAYK